MNSKKLLVIGSSNIDLIMRLPTFPKPGETLKSLDYHQAYGGKGANQALAAAKLGAHNTQTTFMSCVGGDAAGNDLLQALQAEQVDIKFASTINNALTGTAMIWLSATGENSIAIAPAANAHLSADYVQAHQSAIIEAEMLLLQLETPLAGVIKAIEIAKAHNKTVILNPAPAQTLPTTLLSQIDIITPNETEAEKLTNIAVNDEYSAKAAADYLHRLGIRSVIITRGASGVFCSIKDTISKNYPGFEVEVIDTTAAGDTFNGALASALLQNKCIDDAITFAQAAAALSVQKLGAQPSIPDVFAVEAFLLGERCNKRKNA